MGHTRQEAEEIARQLGRTGQARGMRTLPRMREVAPQYGGGYAIEQVPICRCRIEAEPFDADGRGKDCRRGPFEYQGMGEHLCRYCGIDRNCTDWQDDHDYDER